MSFSHRTYVSHRGTEFFLYKHKHTIWSWKQMFLLHSSLNRPFTFIAKTGPGLFESVYEEMLWYKLNQLGLFIERQKEIPVYLDGIKMGIGFRADLIIDQQVNVEIKSIERLLPVHAKQLLTYL